MTKKGAFGNAAGHHLSKTSRKLAKYSAAKYLQGTNRLHSDMMSLDTEHCLHTSADSFASDGGVTSSGAQLQANHHSSNKKHHQLGDDQMRPTSPTASFSTSSNNHYQKSRLSISSIARTTTTCLSSSSTQPTSDPLSTATNCSTTFGVVLQSPLATNQSSRFLSSCTKATADSTGYSIITEEGSSSSSGALPPPLNGGPVALGCLEGELEPDVNEHSPLPVVSSSISDKSTTNDLIHSANASALSLHHQTFSESPCRCDHSYQLHNKETMQQQHYQLTATAATSKRHSLAQQSNEQSRGWPLSSPSRAKSLSMSISPNDANQRALLCGRMGALFDRYRAQSTEERLEPAALQPSVLSALADDDDDADESATATATTSALDSANRVNNDAGTSSAAAFRQGRGYSLANTDCVADFVHRLPSDSNLIAIDTNYCQSKPDEALPTNCSGVGQVQKQCTTVLCNNECSASTQSPSVICTVSDHASTVVQLSPMMHRCIHSANGGLSQQQHITSNPTSTSSSAALTVANIGTTTQPILSMPTASTTIITTTERSASSNKQLKEDSTSSSGSTSQPNQSNHRVKGNSKKKSPNKESSEHSNPSPSPHQSRLYQKESIESKRERKAAKTLAIITGTYF